MIINPELAGAAIMTTADLLTACRPSVRFSTAPCDRLDAETFSLLLAQAKAEGCEVTGRWHDEGVWHGHHRESYVWTISGPARRLTGRESWNCCTGAAHHPFLAGYCPEWAAKLDYAATIDTGSQRDRALAAAQQCRALSL